MENNNTIEEFEDALSLCDFALCDQESSIEQPNSPSRQGEDFFEFFTSSTSSEPNSTAENDDDDQRYNNPLLSPSSSSPGLLNQNKTSANKSSSKPALPPVQTRSSSSKKHKVIIGLTKIPSKMELSDLRERQNRKQTSSPMFPKKVDDEALAVSGKRSNGKSHNWGLLRPFRCRAQDVTSMLTKSSSLGCLRLARPCLD
ncbi:conserved hypothetical protein [Ricinus communis]|uniref:Uncharacterized protein n=1 Tax=Ricinus communis TaxID=3988 RepID=B9SUP4_RICCO|nr:conserved hypothetical protein [Ricinus communis]